MCENQERIQTFKFFIFYSNCCRRNNSKALILRDATNNFLKVENYSLLNKVSIFIHKNSMYSNFFSISNILFVCQESTERKDFAVYSVWSDITHIVHDGRLSIRLLSKTVALIFLKACKFET